MADADHLAKRQSKVLAWASSWVAWTLDGVCFFFFLLGMFICVVFGFVIDCYGCIFFGLLLCVVEVVLLVTLVTLVCFFALP